MTNTKPQAHQVALWFSLQGDLKYLSHRDTLRLWQRALTRAYIPVKYSQGFNPHMRICLPLPRNVGIDSEKELLMVNLENPVTDPEFPQTLQNQLPPGITLTSSHHISGKISPHPQWVRYRITLAPHTDTAQLQQRINLILNAPSWPLTRSAHGRHPRRTIDLRAGLRELSLQLPQLHYTLSIGNTATPRIDELLNALEIIQPEHVLNITRTDIGYDHPDITN
jgi:radical SAM-linked protein